MSIKDKLPATREDLNQIEKQLDKMEQQHIAQIREIREQIKEIGEQIKSLTFAVEKTEKRRQESNRAGWMFLHEFINVKSKSKYENNFMAAIPDSLNYFHKYSEYQELYPLFIGKNHDNNVRDFTRLYMFILNINYLLSRQVEGAFAELGVYKGDNCAVMMHYCKKYGRKLFMFDTFEGFDRRDLTLTDKGREEGKFSDTSLEEVKRYVGENKYSRFIKGFFPDSITEESKNEVYAFVSLDCDLYHPMKAGLEFFYPRLGKGGMIFMHDYSSGFYEGCTRAVDEFCENNELSVVLMPDKSGTAVLIKH